DLRDRPAGGPVRLPPRSPGGRLRVEDVGRQRRPRLAPASAGRVRGPRPPPRQRENAPAGNTPRRGYPESLAPKRPLSLAGRPLAPALDEGRPAPLGPVGRQGMPPAAGDAAYDLGPVLVTRR